MTQIDSGKLVFYAKAGTQHLMPSACFFPFIALINNTILPQKLYPLCRDTDGFSWFDFFAGFPIGQVIEYPLSPGCGQKHRMGFYVREPVFKVFSWRKNAAPESAGTPPLSRRLHRAQCDVAGVEAVLIGHAVKSAGEDILQQGQLIHGDPGISLRRGDAQVFASDTEYGCSQCVDPVPAAYLRNMPPIDLASVFPGKQTDVTDLPDAESGIDQMLVGMAEQIQQMVRGTEGADRDAIDIDLNGSGQSAAEYLVHLSDCFGIRSEGQLVNFDIQVLFPIPVLHLIGTRRFRPHALESV